MSRNTNWKIQISDPSGESRTVYLKNQRQYSVSRELTADILLRDPTLPRNVAEIVRIQNNHETPQFWLKMNSECKNAFLGSLEVREAMLQPEIPVKVGETEFKLSSETEQVPLPSFPPGVKPWLTQSDSGTQLLWTAKKAAQTPLSIYIAGETGTGKEVIAHLLHAWSDRASGPFVPLHCGALPVSLAESELFGHTKGSFTGASHQRTGAFLQAHGGTLFLDEIGDLSLDLQVKLLRFLEDGEIRAVGSDRVVHADVRILCATHLPLLQLVEEGKFRRDLYYRLASVTLEIPTLRSRAEDIEMLARKFASDLGKSIAAKTLLRLKTYPWPGNVRELRHAIERAAGLSGAFQTILEDDAFSFLGGIDPLINDQRSTPNETITGVLTLEEMERVMLLRALRLACGNRGETAKILGIARSTLFEMLKRYKIEGPRAHLFRNKLKQVDHEVMKNFIG